MKFIQGHNRTQINLSPVSLGQSIDPENEVPMLEEYSRLLAENDGDCWKLLKTGKDLLT
jgi:hypothetical protein